MLICKASQNCGKAGFALLQVLSLCNLSLVACGYGWLEPNNKYVRYVFGFQSLMISDHPNYNIITNPLDFIARTAVVHNNTIRYGAARDKETR